ncbi:MAG: cyclase family protein [Capsulimonadaceae bacterium]
MKIHDISITTTSETVTWEGEEKGHTIEWLAEVGADSVASLSVQSFGSHTGTHLDAPRHFIEGGATVESLDLTALVGPADVAAIEGDVVTAAALEAAALPADCRRLLLRTTNTSRGLIEHAEFHRDYVGIAPDAAVWIVDRGIRLVGIDYMSIGPYGPDNVKTHRILLGAGVVVVETLLLAGIEPGRYFLAALPPKIAGLEGTPCRAILIEGLL